MKTDGVSRGPITQASIRGRSLRAHWLKNKAAFKKLSKIPLERV
jgi:hypothetical protein